MIRMPVHLSRTNTEGQMAQPHLGGQTCIYSMAVAKSKCICRKKDENKHWEQLPVSPFKPAGLSCGRVGYIMLLCPRCSLMHWVKQISSVERRLGPEPRCSLDQFNERLSPNNVQAFARRDTPELCFQALLMP